MRTRREIRDHVIGIKMEKIGAMQKSINILSKRLVDVGNVVDLTEDEISETLAVLLSADDGPDDNMNDMDFENNEQTDDSLFPRANTSITSHNESTTTVNVDNSEQLVDHPSEANIPSSSGFLSNTQNNASSELINPINVLVSKEAPVVLPADTNSEQLHTSSASNVPVNTQTSQTNIAEVQMTKITDNSTEQLNISSVPKTAPNSQINIGEKANDLENDSIQLQPITTIESKKRGRKKTTKTAKNVTLVGAKVFTGEKRRLKNSQPINITMKPNKKRVINNKENIPVVKAKRPKSTVNNTEQSTSSTPKPKTSTETAVNQQLNRENESQPENTVGSDKISATVHVDIVGAKPTHLSNDKNAGQLITSGSSGISASSKVNHFEDTDFEFSMNHPFYETVSKLDAVVIADYCQIFMRKSGFFYNVLSFYFC